MTSKIRHSILTRSWLLAAPLFCLSAGCNSAAETGTAQAPAASETASVTTVADDKSAHADHNHADGAHNDEKNTNADPAYRVVDPREKYGITEEALKNASPAEKKQVESMLSALDHVKVPPPAKDMKVPDKPRVVLETSKGKVTVELNGKEAPLHTKNFLHLTKIGFYDGTTFHRFADLEGGGKGRIVQGGDPFTKVPTTTSMAGQGGPGYEVPREKNKLKHEALVLAAARSSDPNSAGSQFYFTLDPVNFLDEGDGYTVFGKVVDGKDVVMKLRANDKLKKVTIAQ